MKEKVVISQALIDLLGVVKEQQELLTILVEGLPESEYKTQMLGSIERTTASVKRIDGNITAAIVEGARDV
jgi:hypothetical protein